MLDSIKLFSTPIWRDIFPDFNKEKEKIVEFISNNKNNTNNIHIHQFEEFFDIFTYISVVSNEACNALNFIDRNVYITSSWAEINNGKIFFNEKSSQKELFSGAFCIKTAENNKLVLPNLSMNCLWKGLNLVTQKNDFVSKEVKIDLQEGELILWPSYLPHHFEKNNFEEDLILLCFNVIAIPTNEI